MLCIMKNLPGLYARDDDYSFDFITPAPAIDLNDTTSNPLTEETTSFR